MIQFYESEKAWVLATRQNWFILQIGEYNIPNQRYFGRQGGQVEDYFTVDPNPSMPFESSANISAEVYPGWGGMRFSETALKVTFADGNRDLKLKYESHVIRENELVIVCRDEIEALFVELHYQVFPEQDLIEQYAVVKNELTDSVSLESFQSGIFHLPALQDYRMTSLHGEWFGENQVQQELLQPGKSVLESRRGVTGHQHVPWLAFDVAGQASETAGEVYFMSLAWSGNWKLVVERNTYKQTQVTAGYNDFDSQIQLSAGESCASPKLILGYTDAGFGAMSRNLHRYQRLHVLPLAAEHVRPIGVCSWEAYAFDIDEARLMALAERAKGVGAELFLVDDGWFGQRTSNEAGLGDWYPNPERFPNGLGPLIEKVKSLGLQFGLWVEPEMVNPDSELYRAHPDWAVHFPGRERTTKREQLVLNIARDDVCEAMFQQMNDLVAQNGIDYLKWDMNRPISEPGWPQGIEERSSCFWITYTENYYKIVDRLRAAHPHLTIQTCAGGGGRIDMEVFKRTDEAWPSDCSDAYDRLFIQEGYSFIYPARTMVSWVIDAPLGFSQRQMSLEYRFLVSMMGALWVAGDLNAWDDAMLSTAYKYAECYKAIRPVVQNGDLYRLASPRKSELMANYYQASSGDEGYLFVLLQHQRYAYGLRRVKLEGLCSEARYQLAVIIGETKLSTAESSGAYLMQQGLTFVMKNDYTGCLIKIKALK